MNQFIEENKNWLKFYSVTLRLSGWLLLTLSFSSPLVLIILARSYNSQTMEQIILTSPLGSFTILFLALFGIGLSQLVRYLFDSNYKPGLILHHGDKFIYAYIVFTLFVAAKHISDFVRYLSMPDIEVQFLFLSTSIASTVYFIAKIIVLFGIAQFLKRVLPVIEEHKSLV